MKSLYEMNSVTPKKGDTLSAEDRDQYQMQVPDWEIVEEEGTPKLRKEFEFNNFAAALEFTNQVGALAEEEDHHPAILTEWGKTTVTFWTHATGGLHKNDFILAAKTDRLVQS